MSAFHPASKIPALHLIKSFHNVGLESIPTSWMRNHLCGTICAEPSVRNHLCGTRSQLRPFCCWRLGITLAIFWPKQINQIGRYTASGDHIFVYGFKMKTVWCPKNHWNTSKIRDFFEVFLQSRLHLIINQYLWN